MLGQNIGVVLAIYIAWSDIHISAPNFNEVANLTPVKAPIATVTPCYVYETDSIDYGIESHTVDEFESFRL